MNRLRLYIALFLIILAPVCLPAQEKLQVLRPDIAEWDESGLLLQADPLAERVIAAPSVLFHDTSDVLDPGGLEVELETTDAAELEMTGVYRGGKQTLVFHRRSIDKTTGPRKLRWQIPAVDQLSSFTLSLRAATRTTQVKMHSVEIRDFSGLTVGERLAAFIDQPLSSRSVVQPVNEEGMLNLRLALPADLRQELEATPLAVLLESPNGESKREDVKPVFEEKKSLEQGIAAIFSVPVPDWGRERLKVTLLGDRIDGGGEEVLATVELHDASDRMNVFELPFRSAIGVSVMERNGEIALYTVVTEEGIVDREGGAPAITDMVWLASGNGRQWSFSEPLLRGRRDSDWIAGGPRSFSVASVGNEVTGYFTSVSRDGVEALSSAYSRNSLRVTSYAKNPVWTPEARYTAEAPLWRGNALFVVNGSPAVIGIEAHPGGQVYTRLLVSSFPARWADLGFLPLPGFDPNNRTLSAGSIGDSYYLIAGPNVQLFRAKHSPLRGWERLEFAAPDGWADLSLVNWGNTPWLFGITRINGRGVVTWAPIIDKDDGTLDVLEDFEFRPLPLKRLPGDPGPREEGM